MRDENTERPSQNIKRKDSDTMNILEKAKKTMNEVILEGDDLKAEVLKIVGNMTSYFTVSKQENFDSKSVEFSYNYTTVGKKKKALRKVDYSMRAKEGSGVESCESHFLYDGKTNFGKATDYILSSIGAMFYSTMTSGLINVFDAMMRFRLGEDEKCREEKERDEFFKSVNQMVEYYKASTVSDMIDDDSLDKVGPISSEISYTDEYVDDDDSTISMEETENCPEKSNDPVEISINTF